VEGVVQSCGWSHTLEIIYQASTFMCMQCIVRTMRKGKGKGKGAGSTVPFLGLPPEDEEGRGGDDQHVPVVETYLDHDLYICAFENLCICAFVFV